jgi:hypothetical protein
LSSSSSILFAGVRSRRSRCSIASIAPLYEPGARFLIGE